MHGPNVKIVNSNTEKQPCQTYLQNDRQSYNIWTHAPTVWKILGIWDTHKIAPSDSPCGRTKYGTSVWKRDYAYKCVSLILPRDTGNAKCRLCAREAGQEMDKIHGYIHKPKFDHSAFSKWINSTCMELITPIPMPQTYKIGAQSEPCNTQGHTAQTILKWSSWSSRRCIRQSTRTVAAVQMNLWASKLARAIGKSLLTTKPV